MSEEDKTRESGNNNRNMVVALSCAGLFFVMVGASYAAVPLYKLFCQVTGYGGTTQVAERESETVIERKITVRLDGNVNHELYWEFKPKQRTVTLHMGETGQVAYVARNLSERKTVGTSVFNVTPNEAGAYFNKLECFCFTEQPLESGERVEMPVVFFVDPEMDRDPELKNVKEITLSYTFFPVPESEAEVSTLATETELETKL
ncbi:MAG: cytochrome c oxidase assembly protein [Rhodobacteraceae bacterium]|nr:cytochrome c oxidase assembly protein [Paracoccaceae bacterium]